MRYSYDRAIVIYFSIDHFVSNAVSCCAIQRYPKLNFVIHNDVFITFDSITVLSLKIATNVVEAKLFMDEAQRNHLLRLLF